jgi:hypothetical protein
MDLTMTAVSGSGRSSVGRQRLEKREANRPRCWSGHESEPLRGLLRVERLLLGADIAAVRMGEAPGHCPVRTGNRPVLRGCRCGTHWRRHEPGRGDDEHEGEALPD